MAVRDAVIVVGRERGITSRELAEALGLDPPSVTRRVDAARSREKESQKVHELRKSLDRPHEVTDALPMSRTTYDRNL